MNQTRTLDNADIGSDALLSAYQLLIETTVDSDGDDVLLQRALAVLAAIRWPAPHTYFSALLTDPDSDSLRLAAFAPDSAEPPRCAGVSPAACVCGRALIRPGRLFCITTTDKSVRPPCDPRSEGTHLILPLAARGSVLGVLHALVEPGRPPGESERSFLVQVATLLGAELHRRRSEREHERLESQFLQAQKMEAVGRLAGGVAHDFNNILTAITSYADLGLLRLSAQSPLRRNFDEILSAADRASLLTQQLLAFSRRQVLAPRVIDVNAVLAELGKTLRRLLGADIDLSITTDPALARIVADPVLIEQMIINLMVSARETMPRGGTIIIETANSPLDAAYTLNHPEVTPGAYIRFSVSARGRGLAPVALWAICAPGGGHHEPTPGAALGPAAVKDIIRQSGGHAQAEATADCEVTLRIYFPAAGAEAAIKEATDGTNHLPGGSETILLAEDDDSVRVIMVEILRDLGYRVLEARDGREALDLAAVHEGPIDVLLTDVVLRGFGGCELLRRLAATRPDLRVLLVSGVTDDDAAACPHLATPGAVFLQKPFSPWALASRLRQVLDPPSPAQCPC